MKNTLRQIHSHIKHHHKKYLFGIFGGYAVIKLFLLILWFSVVEYGVPSFAQLQSGCVLTGQYYTWEYQTWGYITGQELTGWALTNCVTLSWYFTGGTLDESGSLTWETRIPESQTWCELTWQALTWWYMTGYYLTWWYRTGGTLTWCTQEQTGNNQTWNITLWNGICESGDVVWSTPMSWSIVRNIFPITWSYSGTDCISGLSLQLRDHNNQWINLSTLASWTTSYMFDSRRLYSFQLSGFYNIIGNTGGWNFMLYSWIYSGNYSRLFSWYKLRLITSNQTTVQETSPFIIDNQIPTLTWVTLISNWSNVWYLAISGVVTLSFTASEELSWLQVTLWSGQTPSSTIVAWLLYTYTRNLTSLYNEGILTPIISFSDKAGNTGSVTYVSSLVFDKTKPVVSGIIFSWYESGIYLIFTWSENIRYTFVYNKLWWASINNINNIYLTGQQIILTGVDRDQSYMFTLTVFDRAGNSRIITGDFLRNSLWIITQHIAIVSLATESVITWTLAALWNVLKAEVEKFNACKNALSYTPVELEIRRTKFTLQMPIFKKSQVKTLVNAFTLYVLNEIKGDYTIEKTDIDEITKKFDSFLIILKLLRDDDNTCKQNLSNYHISQFKTILHEYDLNNL